MVRGSTVVLMFIVSTVLLVGGLYATSVANTLIDSERVLVSGQTIFGINDSANLTNHGVFLYNLGIILVFVAGAGYVVSLIYFFRLIKGLFEYGYVFD